ncbi:MAG: HAD family phosphatase [Planctomycetaceae bacterium]|nr:HAD family phosphatase [Planctomycetaceae bacterium]
MPNIRAVCFDLDGLMFNTEVIFNEVGHELLRRRDRVMTHDLITAMMGRRAIEAVQVMIDWHELSDTAENLIDESQVLFFELAKDRLEAMPGLFELLEAIESRNLPKGVATSSTRSYLEKILGKFRLIERFHSILTAEDVQIGKPNPEIYLKAAARLGVAPEEMLVLEDSQAGTNAASAAGAFAVSIPHEHSAAHDFSNASLVADSLHDSRVMALVRGL